jgi:hypothetical protein
MKTLALILALLTCVGCTSLQPIPADSDKQSFTVAVGTIGPDEAPMAKINTALVLYMKSVSDKADSKAQYDWNSGDITLLGAILAAAGGIADKTGLLNTGIGLSGLGVAGRERYQFNAQTRAYDTARKRLICIHMASLRVTDDVLTRVRALQVDEIQVAVRDSPYAVIRNVERVKDQLRADLRSITTQPPSRESLLDYLRRYEEASKLSDGAKKTATNFAVEKHKVTSAKSLNEMTAEEKKTALEAQAKAKQDADAEAAMLVELASLVKVLPTSVEGCATLPL